MLLVLPASGVHYSIKVCRDGIAGNSNECSVYTCTQHPQHVVCTHLPLRARTHNRQRIIAYS